MSRSHPLSIGLVIECIGTYGRGVLRGIMAYARSHPDWAINLVSNHTYDQEASLDGWHGDGLIVQVFSRPFEQHVLDRGIPASNVSNMLSDQRLATVVPDDLAVGRLAATYLLERGWRRFGFYGPDPQYPSEYSDLRRDSFLAALRQAGHEPVVRSETGDLAAWVADLPKPIAILACNDDWAHRLLSACRRSGTRVPDDVAVLGVDDDELFNAIVTPSLSSIALPIERVGYEAATLLDRLIQQRVERTPQPPPRVLRLPPLGVVTRQSTEVVASGDAEVAAALRFIREHEHKPIQVEDVLKAGSLSRRALERHFTRSLGRSILSEIARVHVERARQLLLVTDLSLEAVARSSGFSSATRLGIVFRKLMGVTPSQFRRQVRLPPPHEQREADEPAQPAPSFSARSGSTNHV